MGLRFRPPASNYDNPQQHGTAGEAIDRVLIPVGVGDDGAVFERALSEVSAMLVAGTTGSGKSSFVKTLVAEIMEGRTPRDVNFVIGDSSRIEYACCTTSPFLAMPIARDAKQTETLIRLISSESDRRMALLSRGTDSDYPRLFVILDDFVALEPSGDLLASLERAIQMARLTKMHFMLVTSLPSSRLLTSGILSNIDCRVAFRVTSRADSLRVLDRAGANQLMAQGEMIYRSGGAYTHCTAAHIEDAEIRSLCDEAAMRYEYGAAFFAIDLPVSDGSRPSSKNGAIDESLVEEAARIVVETRLGSTSGLQRRLKVGYAQASRIMDELEARGIVGPANGSRPRDVLVDSL